MTFLELQEMIMDESHRSDLAAQVPSFVARAEAMIARELRATEMLTITSLLEASRIAADSPIYTLPTNFLEDKSVVVADVPCRKVGRDGLLRFSRSALVRVYTLRSDPDELQIEFRGTPGTDADIELEYFCRLPALEDDADTNRLLNAHESTYLHAALFALYMWTQDTELAQSSLETWQNARDTLNEQAGRYLGGTGITPSLNLGHFRTGGSY